MKPVKDWTFEEFVAHGSRTIMDKFITNGGKGITDALYLILPLFNEWNKSK